MLKKSPLRLSIASITLAMLAGMVPHAHALDLIITVHKGDTLLGLCRKYLEVPAKCRQVARLNQLRNPDLITPGQKLAVPVDLLKSAPVAGVVTFLKGNVVHESPGRGERRPLLVKDEVREGGRIFTDKESSVEIAYEDGTSFLLRPDSNLSLVRSRRFVDSGILRDFFLQAGEIINKIQRATGQEQRYNIRTPSAVAGTRGTTFKVAVDPAETTRSGVLQGTIDVSAMEQTVSVAEGEGTLAHKGSPPLPPRRLLTPPIPAELHKSYRTDPFQIRFAGVEKAASFRVMLTRDAGMKDVIREAVIKPGEPYVVMGIPDGAYWMQALSIDELGLEGAFSAPVPVEVRVNPLPPNILAPADGSALRDHDVSFQWLKVGDAAGYHLQVARDKEFADKLVDLKNGGEVASVVGGLAVGSYFFRLSSVATDGYEGEWSNTLGFTVVPPPPTPDLEKPVGGEKEIRVRVRESASGLTYHFQIAKDPGFAGIFIDETVKSPELVFPRPDEPGTYYVRSRCSDAMGYSGAFSPPQSFELKRSFPYGLVGAGLGAVGVVLLILL